MIDPEAITEAKRVLGRQLAACREAVGFNQHQLAPQIHYGRSTIANAETGYSTCSRVFWERCDQALQRGSLQAGVAPAGRPRPGITHRGRVPPVGRERT